MVKIYYGIASGGSKKALRKIGEPNRMLSFTTENNTPPTDNRLENLFIDCGGYQVIQEGEYKKSCEDYIDYIQACEPEKFALRDYPADPELTTQMHRKTMDLFESRGIDSMPVCVLTGNSLEDYLEHLDMLRDEGLLTRRVGIGALKPKDEVTASSIISKIRDEVSSRHQIHVFGGNLDLLAFKSVIEAADSLDSGAYSRRCKNRGDWMSVGVEYLRFKRQVEDILEGEEVPESQTSLQLH